MIITPDFVFIHLPKTGGTFVTRVLSKLYGNQALDIDKHGSCTDVPEQHRHKPLLSTVRNPFDRYVSQYYFAWWKLYPWEYCGAEVMRSAYPHYPDLSFEDFVGLANSLFLNVRNGAPAGFINENFPEKRRLGWHTETFMRFYCRNPRHAYASLDEGSIERAAFVQHMFDVHFLRMDILGQELHDYLLAIGHRRDDLAFILKAEKALPGIGGIRPADDRWQNHYTPQLKAFVRTRERLIFRLFPEFATDD